MSNVLLGGITSSPNVGSPNSSVSGSKSLEFNPKELFANGENGGLFIYNQNVFEDVEGHIPATDKVALICNTLGDERRNLYNFSELETGLNTGNTSGMQNELIQFMPDVNGALLKNNPSMSASYMYLKTTLKAGHTYTISCEMVGQDGSYTPLGVGNSAQITFGSRTTMGAIDNLRTDDSGNNYYRISGRFTAQKEESNFFGVGKFVNSRTTPTIVSKFQIEESEHLTDYQHISNYGSWSGLALYTTFDKSEIIGNELSNNAMVLNQTEGLESCTVIIKIADELTVIENVDCTGGTFNHSFNKLFIINRKLTPSELGGIIQEMAS